MFGLLKPKSFKVADETADLVMPAFAMNLKIHGEPIPTHAKDDDFIKAYLFGVINLSTKLREVPDHKVAFSHPAFFEHFYPGEGQDVFEYCLAMQGDDDFRKNSKLGVSEFNDSLREIGKLDSLVEYLARQQ